MHRVAAFIDGPSLHAAGRQLGLEVDFRKLLAKLDGAGRLMGAYYYTPIIDDDGTQSVRPLVDWLAYNGFRVVTRIVRDRSDESGRRRHVNISLGVELTVDMMRTSSQVSEVYLFSGDGAFRALVEAVQQRGVQVRVVSTLTGSIVSDELRRQADEFIEFAQWREELAKVAHTRPKKSRV